MIYNISDIKVGDEVIFNSTEAQTNHDEFWEVTAITGNRIHIKLDKFGILAYYTIDITQVVMHTPL
ncbi:hypothetical protein [Flavobacterium sp.]|uniref:hypothetical protein n=1 Tax=Flavobacterium sp. TaxID=239 RepID=UPI0031E0B605